MHEAINVAAAALNNNVDVIDVQATRCYIGCYQDVLRVFFSVSVKPSLSLPLL
jgi:hypothetical protein